MRFLVVCTTLIAALAAPAYADELATIRAATDARLLQPDGSMPCFPDVKGAAEVYVFNSLGSGDVIPTAIKTERPVRYTDIVVEATEQPVLLALYNSYEAVWRLELKPGARLAGVWINGYERASVVGAPEETPLGRNYDVAGKHEAAPACGLKPGELRRRDWTLKRDALKREADRLAAHAEAVSAAFEAAEYVYTQMPERGENHVVEAGGRALLTAMFEEVSRLQAQAVEARKALSLFEEAPPAWPPEEVHHLTQVLGAMDLWGAENRLKRYGAWRVVYAEQPRRGSASPYVVSSAKARVFLADKAKARAELDAFPPLALPPLRPADGARLQIPKGVQVEAGLEMMVAAGYAVKNGPAQTYINDLAHMQRAAVGMPSEDRSAWLNAQVDLTKPVFELTPTDVYTLLGPVVLPDCQFGRVLFYLPEGVPDPETPGCSAGFNHWVHEHNLRLRDYDNRKGPLE